jgi:hypothetical protein
MGGNRVAEEIMHDLMLSNRIMIQALNLVIITI